MQENIIWNKVIILVDMNAFFASVEQLDNPTLRGKPVVVTNGVQGTCIITCSYEARRYGIKTGMRLAQAMQLCPHLIRCPSRPHRYASISSQIMKALEKITPDIEVFSVDEAFLDVSRCQRLHGTPLEIGKKVKELIFQTSGLLCSVGISSNKTTAKFAAKQNKPNGLSMIAPWETAERLANVPVTELCGIAKGIGNFLAKYGVYHCGDINKLPISVLAKRFGNVGRRIWYMCQGADPEPLNTSNKAPKSLGHGKIIPPDTRDKVVILRYMQLMCEKLALRLRRHHMQAQQFFIGVRSYHNGWIGNKARLIYPSSDARILFKQCQQILDEYWSGEGIFQVQITALDPRPIKQQLDLFVKEDEHAVLLNQVIDQVNQQYGQLTLSPARLLGHDAIPDVIAPAWRPTGYRQHIDIAQEAISA